MQIEVTCIKCKWFNLDLICDAFPEGIPEDILTGEFDHTEKHPDQENDILFVKIEEAA